MILISESHHIICIHIAGGAVSWKSILQTVIALLIVEDEYMVAIKAAKETIWVKGPINELVTSTRSIKIPCGNQSVIHLAKNEAIWVKGPINELDTNMRSIKIPCDNQNVIHLAKNQVYHANNKYIEVRYLGEKLILRR